MIKRIGKRTLALENRPYLLGHAAAVGKKEGEGPLGERFDYVAKNDRMGQHSWELAESELQKTAIRLALRKATLPERFFYINFLSTICLTCRTVRQTISKLLIYAHNKS